MKSVTQMAMWSDLKWDKGCKLFVRSVNLTKSGNETKLNHFSGWPEKDFPVLETMEFGENICLICHNLGIGGNGFDYLLFMYNPKTGVFSYDISRIINKDTELLPIAERISKTTYNIKNSYMGGSFIRQITNPSNMSNIIPATNKLVFLNSQKPETQKCQNFKEVWNLIKKFSNIHASMKEVQICK